MAAGLTVLHPNYRGSDGYGRRWQLANRWLMGQGEVLDVAAGHEFLVRHGCDPSRIAITGRSWGGFHTMAAVTQFPELWAVGVAGVPFFDFIDSQVDTAIRDDLRWWDLQNTGDIEKDRAKLMYYSPINHLDRVEAPLLLLGGALDPAARRGRSSRWPRSCAGAAASATTSSIRTRATRSAASSTASTTTGARWSSSSSTPARPDGPVTPGRGNAPGAAVSAA